LLVTLFTQPSSSSLSSHSARFTRRSSSSFTCF
jgi:hypothetical protein